MKNISRRVFIKGLAVAGVAAAASTVLAGCNTNMIPGTDNEGDADVVPTPSNTYTFKDGDNTLSISAPNFVVSAAAATGTTVENVYLLFDATNKMGADVLYGMAKASTIKKGYGLVLSVKAFDKENKPLTVTPSSSVGADGLGRNDMNKAAASAATLADKDELEGFLCLKSLSNKWAKIVVTAELYKAVADNQTSGNNYYYGNALDKTTFTFTND